MKKVKEITAVLLLFTMLASVFAACSNNDSGGINNAADTTAAAGETAAEETKADYLGKLPDMDLTGFTLSILHYDDTWLTWAQNILDAEAEDGDLLNDAVYERNLYIKDRYKCDLSITGVTNPDSMVRQLAMAGDSSYDIVFMYDLSVLNHLDSIMVWNDIPYVDLTAPWWNPDAASIFDIAGKQVAVCGAYSISVLSRAASYVFNKDIYSQFTFEESIYDSVNNGTWTLDDMYEIAAMAVSDLNGDGVFDTNDRYGISSNLKEHYLRMHLGSGIQYITKDSEGYPVFSLPTDEVAIAKMQHIMDLNRDNNIFQYNQSSLHDGPTGDLFKNAKVIFEASPVFSIEKLRDVEFDIGVVPVPKYDEKQDRYYAPSFGAEVQMMLRSVDMSRLDTIGLLLEAMSIHSHENLVQTYKEVMLKTKYARDDESEAMLDIIFDSIWFEFGQNAWQEIVTTPFFNGVFMKMSDTLISTLASLEPKVNGEIDKLKIAIDAME